MNYLPVDSVVIQERIRKEFDEDKIAELKESILSKGLFNPPVLQQDEKTLVMGENRLRAIKKIYEEGEHIYFDGQEVPYGMLPYATLSDLSDSDLLEAELEENILRQSLSWQERADATRRLHDLRQSQSPKWTAKDTADEILQEDTNNQRRQYVRRDLLLAEHLDDPDVAAAKDEKEAYKVIERKAKEAERQKKVEEVSARTTHHTLLQGDSQAILEDYPDEYFDIICTDPPYGIDVHKSKQRDGEYHEYDDSAENLEEITQWLARESFRITKPQAHLYLFCDIRKWAELSAVFWLAGWEVWERPFIWYKGNTGSFGGTDWGPRRTYEAVLYAAKGRRPVTALYHDVIDVPKPTQTAHPAGKPVGVFSNLLRRSVVPGDRVLDPFCGGGPVFPAANDLMAEATGIEMNDSYHAIAAATLEEVENGRATDELAASLAEDLGEE